MQRPAQTMPAAWELRRDLPLRRNVRRTFREERTARLKGGHRRRHKAGGE